jgi:hypothetical protein
MQDANAKFRRVLDFSIVHLSFSVPFSFIQRALFIALLKGKAEGHGLRGCPRADRRSCRISNAMAPQSAQQG